MPSEVVIAPAFFGMVAFIVWTVVNGWQRQQRLKVMADVNERLIQRLGSVKDVGEFLQSGHGAALLNNNQLGILVQTNSGLPFNIKSNLDLNVDSFLNDRPLGIDRNTGRLGTVFNLDLRYSRFIPLPSSQRIEAFFEAKNLFNVENLAGVNRTVTTNAPGQPNAPISTDGADFPAAGKSGYDQRLMQLGVKFIF